MIKKEKKTMKDGSVKTYVKVVEGYRPGPKLPPKQRTIKSFGYLEDQQDPCAFLDMVSEFDRNRKKEEDFKLSLPSNALMYQGNFPSFNYGCYFLRSVYEMLGIDRFIDQWSVASKFRGHYSLSNLFQFLVISRILNPDSKRADLQRKELYYATNTDFELADIYRALDAFFAMDSDLQKHLHEEITRLTGRDLSYAFYDVTNYYTEVDFNDTGEQALRMRGVSKEHRVDPIVQMGLFLDSNGIPVGMKVFPGNTSDNITLIPAMEEMKATYGAGRMIVIADKGLNSGNNLDYLCNHGNGFVFSQILRGKKGLRYQKELFSEEGWTIVNNDYKYKTFIETYKGKDTAGNKTERKRKVLLYYSGADARMADRKRREKLERAKRTTQNNAYGIKKGQDEYIRSDTVDRETGELIDNPIIRRSVDLEKAEQDSLFDGYFCIITSELTFDAAEIRSAYSGLWRIEESFRIMKTELEARPIYLSNSRHIQAHFLICYVALLIVRVIQHYMQADALPPERLARALNAATCEVYPGGVVHLHDVGGILAFEKRKNSEGAMVDTLVLSETADQVTEDYRTIQRYFHTDFYYAYPKQEVFNRFLKSIHLVEHNQRKRR